jgi:phage terminase small subunit
MKAEIVPGPNAPQPPKAPEHLRPATKHWWQEVVREYELGSHHLRLLELACSAFDRAEQARAQIAKDGAYVPGRYGLRSHPAIAVERDARLSFARLLRELDLDAEAPADRRPPALKRYG